MNDDKGSSNPRQQIAQQIKQNASILVTVSKDPSVDELSAALGLTIMLNNLKKHATAVVSGTIPPAISFLKPEKTFENTVDSLRDFIIALDKEKADHLRYKVDGDVVKIFITPYKTIISEKDLEFTQGDYNVELVLALNVKDKEHLDTALEAHGRIFHDATVATITCGEVTSRLGSITWHEADASSVSEMLVALSEALKDDKPLLDDQISTAFLTGIVAATDRFSNHKTSSKVMTMAAQLMANGANQQLIATKLSAAHEISAKAVDSPKAEKTTEILEEKAEKAEETSKQEKEAMSEKTETSAEDAAGGLAISHEPEGNLDEVAEEIARDDQEEATKRAEEALADKLEEAEVATSAPTVKDLEGELKAEAKKSKKAKETKTPSPKSKEHTPDEDEPLLGGMLNATARQAAEDKRLAEEADHNKTILSHGSHVLLDEKPSDNSSFSEPSPMNAAMVSEPKQDDEAFIAATAPDVPVAPPAQTLEDIDREARGTEKHDDALAAVHAAIDTAPVETPVPTPVPGMSALPPLPDYSTLPPPPPPPAFPSPTGEVPGQLPPLFENPTAPVAPSEPPAPNDPGQFKIPGQS